MGIDPGLSGYLVQLRSDNNSFEAWPMPLDNKEVSFYSVHSILKHAGPSHIYLERAMPMAMGSKHAFNYGRGFAAIEIAIKLTNIPVTYVEPAKWMKALFDGIDARLKPKERAKIAFERLLPSYVDLAPKSRTGKLHEGFVDAALIAYYGRKQA